MQPPPRSDSHGPPASPHASPLGGSRVRRTGIALVHEGERIVPAPDAAADLEAAPASNDETVHYHFPVEIVVVGRLGEEELDRIEERIWTRFQEAIEREMR